MKTLSRRDDAIVEDLASETKGKGLGKLGIGGIGPVTKRQSDDGDLLGGLLAVKVLVP